ncbi:hypothetical protein [Bailinhaonella thermotolerans]|uniref:Uncharacterized protein n=1 Tax=Bailinhaonella thermotolerans TaxID=1070861 RepID=A0A3A3ZZH0_9ACTN|nr:hypothetical protein [Bailinhaonella thermotolerans]RJL21099.1 hypothetical protein D5H75_38460 [Bailinhaonella thermotolerans]
MSLTPRERTALQQVLQALHRDGARLENERRAAGRFADGLRANPPTGLTEAQMGRFLVALSAMAAALSESKFPSGAIADVFMLMSIDLLGPELVGEELSVPDSPGSLPPEPA